MKRTWFEKALFRCYDTYEFMCLKYPKASKRERVRKKWKARYGQCLREMLRGHMAAPENHWLAAYMPMGDFQGKEIAIPINMENFTDV